MKEPCAIRVNGLKKRYGEIPSVDGLDLEIGAGELYTLLGKNGAGKTTTIKMLSCLLRPDSGTAEILGLDSATRSADIRPFIAVSPQETAIAPRLNARENLALMGGMYGLPAREIKRRSDDLLSLMELEERSGECVHRLSGGMQRKLSIAMALVSKPKILFLDEPTLGLDPESRRNLWDLILSMKGSTTTLLTTHYLEEADYLSDRIGFMRKGKIVAEGSVAELKAACRGTAAIFVQGRDFSGDFVAALGGRFHGVRAEPDGITIADASATFESVAGFAAERGQRVDGISTREASLDDVFFALSSKGANE